MMGMSLSLAPVMTLRQTMRQQLVVSMRLSKMLSMRIELLAAVFGAEYGANFRPNEQCPHCSMKLTLTEVLNGFSNSPTDTLSTCVHCKRRYQPFLTGLRTDSGAAEIAFYCRVQTLHGLPKLVKRPFAELALNAYGRSAMIHFGNLRAAFAEIGLTYDHDPRKGWQQRIAPFLGEVPDAQIAKVVGVSRSTIRRMREDARIKPFKSRGTVK